MTVEDAAAALDAPLGDRRHTSAATSRGARPPAGARRHVTIDAIRSEVERVADRAIEAVIATRVSPAEDGRTTHDELVGPVRDHRGCWSSPTACSSPRSSRSSARRGPTWSTWPRRAAGWPRGWRASWPIRGGRTATSPRRRWASRSRASASACTASRCIADGSRRG